MAVLPPVQLLSWSSARLLALLLNALCGLYQYLDRDKNGIDTGRGKADIDWDTPLGLRLIQESLQTIDRQLRGRGFHPTIFSAIRNLSVQGDFLLKERMDGTRNRNSEMFEKLMPLFMVRSRMEFGEHKLVDEGLRWADKEQSDRSKTSQEGGGGTKDKLWLRETADGLSCLLSSMHPKCKISSKCAEYFSAKGKIGTALSEQLFFLQLLHEELVTKCSEQLTSAHSDSNFSLFGDIHPNLTTSLTSEKCANIFDELNAWTTQKNSRKKLARANVEALALLTEQTFLCGRLGFVQFATPQLLVTLLSWQHPKLGCWTAQKPDLINNFGVRTAIELEMFKSVPLEGKMSAENEKTEMSSREDAHCLPHLSIVAGLAISSVYLRVLLDPGPWPELSLAEHLIQIDGIVAEDKFCHFSYLEWVRDSLLAAGVERTGLQLLRPPSSSWSPDLIAFVFLLFFIIIIFILFVHFFGTAYYFRIMDEEQLLDYEEEQEETQEQQSKNDAATNGDATKKIKGNYASIHSSGFRDLMLRPELLRAIIDCGFEHPSEVQHECIPQAILGMDIVCQAKSGMGKTAVFVLATLQQLTPTDGTVSVLVMCHTRELAFQISKEYERFSKYMPGVKVSVFFGGMPIKKDEEVLAKNTPHIVVGTPGRLLALGRTGHLKLKGVKFFVLDECDKMIGDADMRHDVQEIFKMTPQEKQVMMFSATLPRELRVVCKKFMQEPMEVYVDDEAKLTLHGLQQYYVRLKENEKNRKLLDLLDALEFNQVVIFLRSVSRCRALNQLLIEQNFPSIAIHRAMAQEERLARYQQFKDFQKRILVATNLFGRGMDIERVNIVFNYDMPEDTDTYLHRVARAGRFGTKGLAITFVSDETDAQTLNSVQDRFDVTISELPDQIDVGSYIETRTGNNAAAE
ncbi:hypothetical protein niasHT_018159 [Heterodera trifolii]|uniref:RNA helicase n=1 Tax=Heterodera trifolii TaxID=157864 RepID=A0ABD2LKA8_9BILA